MPKDAKDSSWESLSKEAKRSIEIYLDPVDELPHPEIVLMNSKAFDWLWNYLGLLDIKASSALIAQTPKGELIQKIKTACIFAASDPYISNTWKALNTFTLVKKLDEIYKDEAPYMLKRHLERNVVFQIPKSFRTDLIKALEKIEGEFLITLAQDWELTVEQIDLLTKNINPTVRWYLVYSVPLLRGTSPLAVLKLLGDKNRMVADEARKYFHENSRDFDCTSGFAIKFSGQSNWFAWPDPSWPKLTDPPLFQIPQEVLSSHPLLFVNNKNNTANKWDFVTLEGDCPDWKLLPFPLTSHKQTFPKLPNIRSNYKNQPKKAVSPLLCMEVLFENSPFQLWKDKNDHEIGWTSFESFSPNQTVKPDDWLKNGLSLSDLEGGLRKIAKNEFTL